MISLNIKRAENIDIDPEMRSFFGREGLPFKREHLSILCDAKNNALLVVEPSEMSKLALQRYINHLINLAPIFAGYQSRLHLQFVFYDGLSPISRISSSSPYFELGSLLLNLSAIHR